MEDIIINNNMELQTIYSEAELKKIQSIQLTCLKEIAQICERKNVEYFLIGGSALGAIRHNGYIPWDDDIDIAIPRKDYRRFLEIAENELSSLYHVQSPYNDKHCPYYYSKIRIDNTIFMEYCNRNLPIHHGVYVDVFPYDNVPDDDELNKRHFDRCQKLIRQFAFRQIPDVSCKPQTLREYMNAIVRRCIHYAYRIIPYSIILNQLENEFTKYNNTETIGVACLNFPKRKTEYILKRDLYPLVKHRFEDTEFPVPNNCDAYLTNHYGKYMKLPPKELRYSHKPCKVEIGL